MQFIEQNVNILPRSYWAEARNLFNFIQYKFYPKKLKKEKFQCRCSLQYAGRININDFYKLGLIYFNVSVIIFLCLEPLWETGVIHGKLLRENSHKSERVIYEFKNNFVLHTRKIIFLLPFIVIWENNVS